MPAIICAIRGGPDSQPTIEKSITLAKKTDLPVYFLYVVNLDFLKHSRSSHLKTISDEMRQLGEFILMSAQSRAASRGAVAEGVIRQGTVKNEIIQLCNELAANYVVLGRPRGDSEINVFTHERLQGLVRDIEENSEASVVLADG